MGSSSSNSASGRPVSSWGLGMQSSGQRADMLLLIAALAQLLALGCYSQSTSRIHDVQQPG